MSNTDLIIDFLEDCQTHGVDYARNRLQMRWNLGAFDKQQVTIEANNLATMALAVSLRERKWYIFIIALGLVGGFLDLAVVLAAKFPQELRISFCLIVAGAIVLATIYARFYLDSVKRWQACKTEFDELLRIVKSME